MLPLAPRTPAAAIGYVRVSSSEAARDGLSLTVQARRIRDYAAAGGHRLVEVVADPGVSASRPFARRPGGKRVVSAIESGAASVVIAVKLDRLFRSTVDCLETVGGWRVGAVAIHIVADGAACLDTSTPMGRMMLTMRAAFAEMERQFVSERTRDVMAWKRSQGLHTGGKVRLGYRVTEDGRLVEDPAEQRCLRIMHKLWDEGRGLRPWAIMQHMQAHVPHPRGSTWTYELVKRHLPGWTPGYRREQTEYPEALRKRVVALRKRGTPLAEIGRTLIRDGFAPIGEVFHRGTLSKIARGRTGR